MRAPKYTLTEREFSNLRDTLVREASRYRKENIDAAYHILVKRLPFRLAAELSGASLNSVQRIARELWGIANGLSKWDLYLDRIPTSLVQRTGIEAGRRRKQSHPPGLRCLCRTIRARSGGMGWALSIQRKSDNKVLRVNAFFADSVYGGEAAALEVARARRDEFEKQVPARNVQPKQPSVPLGTVTSALQRSLPANTAGATTGRLCSARDHRAQSVAKTQGRTEGAPGDSQE